MYSMEHKLEHTSIHEEYATGAEGILEEGCQAMNRQLAQSGQRFMEKTLSTRGLAADSLLIVFACCD